MSSGPSVAPGNLAPADIAKYIDHTLLKPDASTEDIHRICDEAKKYHFASVCVNPSYIKLVAELLNGSGVTPCCVIGFPFGTQPPESKANEALDAICNGARELDMVINVGAIKSKDWLLVKRDIMGVVDVAHTKAKVKVILETCLLTDEEKVKACTIAKMAGADFVKTSTGYSTGGAKVEDVALMRATVGPDMGVKASGGIHSYEDAVKMIRAGASRIGASASISIVSGDGGSPEHKCINCGACRGQCPTGNCTIIKTGY
ncbi:MAG: deoxyribose-phosphate aldolase [Oscillospiraceae bacterium]|nr:deoxyribose-phosphate aldolase [Oscillospiraceae bacterium]